MQSNFPLQSNHSLLLFKAFQLYNSYDQNIRNKKAFSFTTSMIKTFGKRDNILKFNFSFLSCQSRRRRNLTRVLQKSGNDQNIKRILNSDNPRVWQKNSSLKTTPKVGSRPRCGCDTVVEVSLSDPTVRSSNPTLKYSFQRIKVSLKFLSPEQHVNQAG